MREKLKQVEGKRLKVKAEVSRFGKKRAYKGLPLDTICLINLIDYSTNAPICDHIWFVIGKQIKELNLSEGDTIVFSARSQRYTKGYKGRREDIDDATPVSTDYKLSNPTKFSKLNKSAVAVPGTLF